jgi:hypothetical protein
MRWISLPYELAPPYLLDVRESPAAVRALFAQAGLQLDAASSEAALDTAREAYGLAKRHLDRHSQSLALLFRAEAFRRMLHWEDSLEAIRGALHWLELSASPVGRHNEAVAAYLEGVVHWTLHADEKVNQTFVYAQELFTDSARYWDYEHDEGRAGDCRDLIRWMSRILEAHRSREFGEAMVIVPVYELISHTRIRTGAFALPALETMIPADAAAWCLPGNYLPIDLEAFFVPSLSPHATYIAICVSQEGQWLEEAHVGDLLIVEVTGSSPYQGELTLTSDRSFLRRGDGRVEFRPAPEAPGHGSGSAHRGIVGIPRILIGREETL